MTWRELMQFIEKQDKHTLDEEVKIHIHTDNTEYQVQITELLHEGWIPYLAINEEEE
jgi:hypothetical protein